MDFYLTIEEFNKIKDTFIMEDYINEFDINDEEIVCCGINDDFPSTTLLLHLNDIFGEPIGVDLNYFGTMSTLKELGLD